MFRNGSSVSSEWQFAGVSKAGLAGTSWTAATPRWMLPVVSDFDLPAATISSYHDIVAARSAVGRSPSPVRWPGRPPRPVAQCRHFQEEAEDASVSECTWTRSALQALRYINLRLTYLLTVHALNRKSVKTDECPVQALLSVSDSCH